MNYKTMTKNKLIIEISQHGANINSATCNRGIGGWWSSDPSCYHIGFTFNNKQVFKRFIITTDGFCKIEE